MTAIQVVKFMFIGLAALLATGATYMHHVPLALGLGGILVGFVTAAVAVDRDGKSWTKTTQPEQEREGITAATKRALVVGAGSVGASLAKNLESSGGFQVVGFVDDDLENIPDGPW